METLKKDKYVPSAYIIANPIYDTVFKRLMENERVVKFFLSTILDEQVTAVEVCPQEFTYKDDERKLTGIGYSIFRVDFMATIQTKDGKPKKILIEVQKSWDENDLTRFRSYLGEQYRKMDKVNGVNVDLPITTIYILGFNLADVNYACVRVERKYKNMLTGRILKTKSPFIEKLTHDSYVIQTCRITDKRYSTRLDKLLSIFEQNHFVSDDSEISKRYPHQSDDEDIQFITSMLHEIIADPKEREEIEKEAIVLRSIENTFGTKIKEKDKVIEEKDKEIEEKDKKIAEDKKEIAEKDKALEKKDKVIEEHKKALKEDKKVIAESKKALEESKKALEEKEREIAELKRLINK